MKSHIRKIPHADINAPLFDVTRFIFGNILAGSFWCLCCNGHRRAGKAVGRFVEQVLDDALTKEKEKGQGKPIVTYVALKKGKNGLPKK